MEHRRLDAVDGWRALCVLGVILAHLSDQSSIGFTGPPAGLLQTLFRPLLPEMGNNGVTIFFVISGFVIVRSLLQEEREFGGLSLKGFYARRTFRIVPPIVLYLSVILACAAFGLVAVDPTIFRVLTFTCNLPDANCGGILGAHTWSLSVEEQFYLFAPLVFSSFRSARGKVIAGLCAGLVAVLLVTQVLNLSGPLASLRNFLPISAGMLCALNEHRLRPRLAHGGSFTLLLGVASLFVVGRLMDTRLGAIFFVVQIAIVCFCLMHSAFANSAAARALAWPPLVQVGRASYGIYLWQQLATYPFPGAGPGFYLVAVVACVAVVLVLFRFVETPLIRIGRNLSWREPMPLPA